jgi:excisionase family DNA binding protein
MLKATSRSAMLTVQMAAEKAGVSKSLVYIWIEKDVLPHFRLGKPGSRGTIRIDESDLKTFLDSLKHAKRPKASLPSALKTKSVFRHINVR